jgi:membrane peptidoglycan carboxypeptidase
MSAPPRRTGSALLGILGIAVVAGLMLTVGVMPAIALTGSAKGGSGLFAALPDDLKIQKFQQKTEIYAKNGKKDVLLASFFNQNREVIGWQDVPATVKNATLAAEDVRFYEHGGVDPMGIVRALVSNVTHGGSQGASTISQQYVKNVCIQEAELLPTQKEVEAAYAECTGGIQRKLREARNAIGLEKVYKKDQILLGYLNIAGFGGRIYGIESAAQYYFDTHAKDLSIAQAASLMAIVNNPNYLRIDVKGNLAANKERRDYILANERDHGMITAAEYAEAVKTPITTKITPTNTGCAQAKSAAYFCDYVVNVIKNDPAFGKTAAERYNKLQSAGWKIYTTLDMGLQKKAKTAMTAYVPSQSPAGADLGGAAVSVEVGTGHILSMVQSKRFDDTGGKGTSGPGYTATAVNWNTDEAYGGSAGFQPGSTYKTFTLIDWLEKGHGLYEIVDGSPRTLPPGALKACGQPAAGWQVGNDEANEGGYQTVMQATARSVNGAYASMAEDLDLCQIRDVAKSLDVHRADGTDLQTNPSSVLGTNEIAPLTMATAYAGIANGGKVCSAVAIDHITTASGEEVPAPKTQCQQSIPSSVATATGYALHGVLTGNGTAAADAGATGSAWGFAKTGTTDEAKSTWVVGGTTKVVSAVWVGNVNAQKTNLRQVYGWSPCGIAANARHCLWRDIMAANQAALPGATTWGQPDPQYLYGQKVALPDVTGKTVKEAKSLLQKAGFQVKVGGTTASDIEAGAVAATDPPAGTQVSAGSTVTLTRSSGPQVQPTTPATGTVPNVVGMALPDARTVLTQAGYQVNAAQVPGQSGQQCVVLGQLPLAGTPAPAGSAVGVGLPNDPNECQ